MNGIANTPHLRDASAAGLPSRRPHAVYAPRIIGPDGTHRVHVTIGRECDGGPVREVWVDMHKEGTALRSFAIALGRLASLALRFGCPVPLVVHALRGVEGAPCGRVEDLDGSAEASSVPDLVAQVLELEARESP